MRKGWPGKGEVAVELSQWDKAEYKYYGEGESLEGKLGNRAKT